MINIDYDDMKQLYHFLFIEEGVELLLDPWLLSFTPSASLMGFYVNIGGKWQNVIALKFP